MYKLALAAGLIGSAVQGSPLKMGPLGIMPRSAQPAGTHCYADRGYVHLPTPLFVAHQLTLPSSSKISVTSAISAAVQKVSEQSQLDTGRCIYTATGGEMVEICAPRGESASAKTLSPEDVKATLDGIINECSDTYNGGYTAADGTEYKIWAMTSAVQGPSLSAVNKQLSVGSANTTVTRRADEGVQFCKDFAFDGTPFKRDEADCAWKECKDPSKDPLENPNNGCTTYCEQQIVGLLGPETYPAPPFGDAQAPGQPLGLEESVETSVTIGVGAEMSGTVLDAVTAGVSFTYSVTETKAKTAVRAQEVPEDDIRGIYTRWVYFPLVIQSCGRLVEKEFVEAMKSHWATGSDHCKDGSEKVTENFCTYSPYLDPNGDAVVRWATRWEDGSGGKPLPFEEQSESYRGICSKGGRGEENGDPDGDDQQECWT